MLPVYAAGARLAGWMVTEKSAAEGVLDELTVSHVAPDVTTAEVETPALLMTARV
jgi:hypothetical protein